MALVAPEEADGRRRFDLYLAHDFGSAAPSVTYVVGVSPGAVGPDGRWYPRDSILLLDYMLPDMTGKDVIESLKQRDCDITFVTVTGHGSELIAVEMMKLGARDYLIKDANYLDFLPRVLTRLVGDLERERQLARTEDALLRSEIENRILQIYIRRASFPHCVFQRIQPDS